MSETEFFAPWRIVGAFSDGSRLTFDGLTERQAVDAMSAAQTQHGDIVWWDRVTMQTMKMGNTIKPCRSHRS